MADEEAHPGLFDPLPQQKSARNTKATRAELADPPIARIQLETPVAHLDRLFDYLVPEEMGERAVPGARVRVRFGHQRLNGYIIERASKPHTDATLQRLERVIAASPVAGPHIYRLCELTAERWAGTVSDVLRCAIPPRVAKVDKEFSAEDNAEPPADASTAKSSQLAELPAPYWAGHNYFAGASQALIQALSTESRQRARMIYPQRYGPVGWAHFLAELAHSHAVHDRDLVIVVPDQRTLGFLCDEWKELGISAEYYCRLTAEDGPTPRYRNYLRIVHARQPDAETTTATIVVGTRSAVFAPVREDHTVVILDDCDALHIEERAPYWNSRDVALLRSEHLAANVLLLCAAPSLDSQRLVMMGYLQDVSPQRHHRGDVYPRVIAASDDFYQHQATAGARHRIPEIAYRTITEALKTGPVLVQVARTGFIPAVRCLRCGEQARCPQCQGPLGYQTRQQHSSQILCCKWCGRIERSPHCHYCEGTAFKAAHRGAQRTAEELGRAFSNTTVISSSGDHIRAKIAQKPSLVVATVGAEPIAPEGYQAVILLDGDTLLAREGLDTPVEVFHRWVNALALAKPHQEGGCCVVTASNGLEVNSLAGLDVTGYAQKIYHQRVDTGLPPYRRMTVLEGSLEQIEHYSQALREFFAPEGGELPFEAVGPTPLESSEHSYRMLLFFNYRDGAAVTHGLRALRAALSAKKRIQLPRVKVDPDSVL